MCRDGEAGQGLSICDTCIFLELFCPHPLSRCSFSSGCCISPGKEHFTWKQETPWPYHSCVNVHEPRFSPQYFCLASPGFEDKYDTEKKKRNGHLLSSCMANRLSVEARTPLLPMGSCQAGHNLHLCLAHHPPLVCATLMVLLLGLSGLGLGGFLLTHKTGLRSPDIPQDWVSFLRSFGQLTLCPVTRKVTGEWHGSHIVGLLTTLNFGDGPDRNKTQIFQAKVLGSQMGLKGSSAGEWVLVTARVATERTPGICLYFSAAPGLLPSSQPPISCSEEGIGNATLSPRMGEDCVRVWSQEGLVLTKLLTVEELALCGSRLLVLGSFLLLLGGLFCFLTAVCCHPRRESSWSRTRL